MGCGSSTAGNTRAVLQPAQDATTREFDRILEEEKAESDLHFKLLCLGAGESGKSTIIKQLVFLHKQATISPEEQQAYVRVLHGNVLTSISTLVQEAQNFGHNFSDLGEDAGHAAEMVESADSRQPLTPELVDAIDFLWNHCSVIKETYDRRDEFWLLEGCPFYLHHMHRFIEPDYKPTEEDIVMARKRTTGVVETQLKYGPVKWTVIDVGGQRSERRKWLNCFDGAKGMLFTVNLSGYCSVLFEDRRENRMVESLRLFEETVANPVFASIPVFLVLNKKDLFEQLIETKPLTIAFPEYSGPQQLRPCIEFISQQFAARMPPDRPKPLVLLMAARVKKDVQYCFEDIHDVILDANRKGIKSAQDKLTKLRDKFRNEQISEMEARVALAKKNGTPLPGETSVKRDSVASGEKGKGDGIHGVRKDSSTRKESSPMPMLSPVQPSAGVPQGQLHSAEADILGPAAVQSAPADGGSDMPVDPALLSSMPSDPSVSAAMPAAAAAGEDEVARAMVNTYQETNAAATKIQALARGRAARKSVINKEEAKPAAGEETQS